MILSVCIVLYNTNKTDIDRTFQSLLAAIEWAGLVAHSKLYIVDNSKYLSIKQESYRIFSVIPFEIIHGHGNIGFASGHNLVLARELGTYHLVLNPDVELNENSLAEAIAFLEAEPVCGLLSPAANYSDGSKQYLCKRYPSLFDLFLRGFTPRIIRKMFRRRLSQYEMSSETQDTVFWDPPIISGCFMFFRSDIFKNLIGFDTGYMLYFEDFDISLRAGSFTRIAYVPNVKIIHLGGNAARKGYWHIKEFVRSAARFFWTHGLRLF
ncbi:glycosyltransferase [Brucella pseudogrignonensis]|uniref:glycosyltransferase n=1 Tax=Brucella pseudogrignonensis TaxID=419475 RepID=UPI0038B68AE7